MIEYTKNYNEELFHVFGYVKDEERMPGNVAGFLDFEGQASPKSVEKINYFREMNKVAMEKRKKMTTMDAKPDKKIMIGPGVEGGFNLVTFMETLKNIKVADLIEFAH